MNNGFYVLLRRALDLRGCLYRGGLSRMTELAQLFSEISLSYRNTRKRKRRDYISGSFFCLYIYPAVNFLPCSSLNPPLKNDKLCLGNNYRVKKTCRVYS